MKNRKYHPENLDHHLGNWIAAKRARNLGAGRITPSLTKACQQQATSILDQAEKKGWVKALKQGNAPIAVFVSSKPKEPRVRGECFLFFDYDRRYRSKALPWIQEILKVIEKVPRYTRLMISLEEDRILRNTLKGMGFNTRHEILQGNTTLALRELIKKKNPPQNLKHLGFALRPLHSIADVKAALRLQKQVFSKAPQHGNYSHTLQQLRRDEKEYKEVVLKKKGRILGVFEEEKMLGFMGAFIQTISGIRGLDGGFTFCLHPSIQGMGITKTGYRVLLPYLKKSGVQMFHGGTSQPAIQSLGKIMKRKVHQVLYTKI